MRRLILFLIRRKLHVKKNQLFYFNNQLSDKVRYKINSKGLIKIHFKKNLYNVEEKSQISLNFLLSDEVYEYLRREKENL